MPLVTTSLRKILLHISSGFCNENHGIFTVTHGYTTIPPPLKQSVARCKSLKSLDNSGPCGTSPCPYSTTMINRPLTTTLQSLEGPALQTLERFGGACGYASLLQFDSTTMLRSTPKSLKSLGFFESLCLLDLRGGTKRTELGERIARTVSNGVSH